MSNKQLNEEETNKVSGGGIPISYGDICHVNPSKWLYYMGENASYSSSCANKCRYCIYNANRDRERTTCDYPLKHY